MRSALFNAPLLATAIAIAIAFYQVVSGVDLSSGAAVGRTLAESLQDGGWGALLDWFVRLFMWAVVVYVLFISPAVMLGFKRKRAIFLGGTTPFDDEAVLWWLRGATVWTKFPLTNIYQQEKRVFVLLSGRKPSEWPIDLFFSIFPYYWFWSGAALLIVADNVETGWLSRVILIAVYGFATWMLVVANRWIVVRERRRARNW